MKISNLIFIFLVLVSISNACKTKRDRTEAKSQKVKEIDLKEINPNQFAEEEWYMPYYLKHFSKLANAVLDTGQNKGFIDISVWRSEAVNQPYDARIMENILSLAWFYTQQRSWNPYYNDPALKSRLEDALTFWCAIQNTDGKFSEYGYNKWTLAPTAFACKFVGRALYLLADGPEINQELFKRTVDSWRKALFIGFTDEGLWEHGRNYTNQYANLWGGALMYLQKWPDEEIDQLFKQRLNQSISEFQSPCGFFYEKGGPDWGYNLSTHHSDLQVAWEYCRGTILQEIIVKKTSDWYDWFSYNAVPEPDFSCFYLNRAVETRQRLGFYSNNEVEDPAIERWTPQAEFVPMARAFEKSITEFKNSNQKQYAQMCEKYPEVAPLVTGEFNAFSPYAFLHQGMKMWHPTDEQKKEAIAELPYFKNINFINIRHDNRSNTSYSYVRKPGYYAIFNSGKIVTEQQRFGLGLIWNQKTGTFFQSQSASNKAAFGTKAADMKNVYEASDLIPEIKLNGKLFKPDTGIRNFEKNEMVVSYKLGNMGQKEIQFLNDKIKIEVKHSGNFTEIIPLLVSENEKLTVSTNQILIETPNQKIQINIVGANDIKQVIEETDLSLKKCQVIELSATNNVRYEIVFD